MQGRVELLDNSLQTNELKQLERRTGRGKDTVDHPKGLHDDAANALCGSLTMTVRNEALRTRPPSRGLIEDIEPEKARMDREAQAWLLGLTKKKKKKPDEIDLEQLEREMMEGLEEEYEKERIKNKDGDSVVFIKRGW